MPVQSSNSSERRVEEKTISKSHQEIQSSTLINAPIEVVWNVVHDTATYVEAIEWVHEAWIEGDDQLREGGVYVERAKYGLKEGTYRWDVTMLEPPNRSIFYHKNREMETEAEVVCEAIDDETTRFTQIVRFRAFPVFRPLGYILERTVMKKRMQRQLDEMALPNIKRIVESRVAE